MPKPKDLKTEKLIALQASSQLSQGGHGRMNQCLVVEVLGGKIDSDIVSGCLAVWARRYA